MERYQAAMVVIIATAAPVVAVGALAAYYNNCDYILHIVESKQLYL